MKKYIVISLLVIGCGTDPTQGPQGVAGLSGQDGNDGQSCSVKQTDSGLTIKCPDGSSASVFHGQDSKHCDCKHKRKHW
jgi:hypothetical protein